MKQEMSMPDCPNAVHVKIDEARTACEHRTKDIHSTIHRWM